MLSNDERENIILLLKLGYSINEINKITHKSKGTIYTYYKKLFGKKIKDVSINEADDEFIGEYMIRFFFNCNDLSHNSQLVEFFSKNFEKSPNIYKEENVLIFTYISKKLFKFLLNFVVWDISVDILGRNRKSRTIYLKPRDYSLNFKIGFLRGFMDSDGHISNKKIQFSSASQRIMDKTMSFLLECGFIDMNYYFYEEKRKNRVGMYHIALNKSERMNFFRRVQPRNLRKLNAPAGI